MRCEPAGARMFRAADASRGRPAAAQPFTAAAATTGRPEGVRDVGSLGAPQGLRHQRPRAAISWSGGKDSCAALARVRRDYEIVSMITMCDESASRSRSHGLRPEILDAQADRLGLQRIVGRCTWPTYNEAFGGALADARADGVTHVIFGDILFDEHRRWAEAMCAPQG